MSRRWLLAMAPDGRLSAAAAAALVLALGWLAADGARGQCLGEQGRSLAVRSLTFEANGDNYAGNSAAQQSAQQSAAELQHQSYKEGQTSDKVTLPGDILLGGLFPIHMKGTKVECGEINRDRGIQRLEAMLYALDRINADSQLLPSIQLGAILLDSCSSSTYALNQSLEFIRASINTVESSAFECKDKSAPRPKYGSKMIAGVIGGSYSEVSLQVANLLRLFRIPQVSYASTGTALSDKSLYDLFARTVPSDMFQARAIADIVLKLNWSYVSLVSSEGLYGDSGSKEFIKQASARRICIATHEKVGPALDEGAYDAIVASLEKRNATGVVLFMRAEDTRELFLAVKRANQGGKFAWVAADGWGTHQKLILGVEEVAWGAVTVELAAKSVAGFDQYMKGLTPWANLRNPWFNEYWQEWFGCRLRQDLQQRRELAGAAPPDDYSAQEARRRRRTTTDNGTSSASSSLSRGRRWAPSPEQLKQFCSPNLRISESNGYRQEQKVQFVVDAVYAMAHALHKAWFDLCDAQPGLVCDALKELNGADFYSKYLLSVSFKDLAGSEVKFDERGDGLGRYNIYNFRRLQPNPSAKLGAEEQQQTASSPNEEIGAEHIPVASNAEFEYTVIGRWSEKDYFLRLDDAQFMQGASEAPESYCSRPCELGQAKIMRGGDHCCWICKTCQGYEFLPDEFTCRDCGIGRWPVPNKTSCYDLPQKYLRWDSLYSLISLTIACLGIGLTLFVSLIFIKYIDTPVVKASGRELSFILLAGIAFCHLSTFVLLSKPTPFICGSQRFLVNFGFALMYASLLVKTNRISRIFNCARKSAKRPSFISPRSQMLITGVLVAIQIFLTIIWFMFEAPGIRADSPEGKRDEVILKCRAKGKSFIISLIYNMILITTCTIYAVKTRKIPENFNESKFIGFTMYTTIVIWLAFVTMFFGTNNSYEIQINTMCVCISLSAYVTLFCLFSPKISIILLHPDKNVRKLTMNSATYKRPFKPVASFSADDRGHPGAGPAGASRGAASTVSQYNGAQADGASGLQSTTSNVLNLAESQPSRTGNLHESSIVSQVNNSNSAASQYSTSQKTPTTPSGHQPPALQLVGACANCGAHQAIMAAAAAAAAAAAMGPPVPAPAIAASRGHTHHAATTPAVAAAARPTSGQAQAAAKLVHSRIQRTPQQSPPSASLNHSRRHQSEERLTEWACRAGTHRAGNLKQQQLQRRPMGSLGRLNEPSSGTSSGTRCGGSGGQCAGGLGAESSSSLVTSQELTPRCAAAVAAATAGHHHKQGAHDQDQEGSDPMLWNQSIYSIDYCSDCCPSSYCHYSCAACSSSAAVDDSAGATASACLLAHQNKRLGAHDSPPAMLSTLRRKSEAAAVAKNQAHHQHQHQQQVRSGQGQHQQLQARRSQTMEMRPMSGAGGELAMTSSASGSKQRTQQVGSSTSAELIAAVSSRNVTTKQAAVHALQAVALGACASAAAEHQQQVTSSKDKSSEKATTSRRSTSSRVAASSSATTNSAARSSPRVAAPLSSGPILASVERVRSDGQRLAAEASARCRESGGCFSYHDDYEYNYGLVRQQSNSDSENYYCYGDLDGDSCGDGADTRASSIPKDDDDTVATAGELLAPVYHQSAHAHCSSSYPFGAADELEDDEEPAPGDETQRRRRSRSQQPERKQRRQQLQQQPFAPEEHRINSAALIAATLSAGGAIVDSSGSSATTTTATNQQQLEESDDNCFTTL